MKKDGVCVTLNLRLSQHDHEQIKQAAEDSCRSMQREILFRLRQSMNKSGTSSPPQMAAEH